jgi:hypothetical protein
MDIYPQKGGNAMKTLAAVVPEQAGEWCGSDHPGHDPRDAQRGAAYLCNAWGYCIYRCYLGGRDGHD